MRVSLISLGYNKVNLGYGLGWVIIVEGKDRIRIRVRVKK